VDLPSRKNRRDILGIHLRKRCLDPAAFNLEALARAADGFSGSENRTGHRVRDVTPPTPGRALTQDDLLAEKPANPIAVRRHGREGGRDSRLGKGSNCAL